MKNTFRLFIVFLIGITISITSCTKEEIFYYQGMGNFGFEVRDVINVSDSLYIIVGAGGSLGGKIVLYNSKSGLKIESTFNNAISDITIGNDTIWACGDNLTIMYSADTGRTWNNWIPLSYFWEYDISDFKKIHIVDNTPFFLTGKRNMLRSNLYVKKADFPKQQSTYPIRSMQLETEIHSMTAALDTSIYVAGWGSILHVNKSGDTITYEPIGNHVFTGITFSAPNILLACTFDGVIYKKILPTGKWVEVSKPNTALRHIASDALGNVVCLGDKSTIYTSKDFGDTWSAFDYDQAKDVTNIAVQNNKFYICLNDGQIHTLSNTLLQ